MGTQVGRSGHQFPDPSERCLRRKSDRPQKDRNVVYGTGVVRVACGWCLVSSGIASRQASKDSMRRITQPLAQRRDEATSNDDAFCCALCGELMHPDNSVHSRGGVRAMDLFATFAAKTRLI